MAERSTGGALRTGYWVAFACVLGIVAIALGGCATGQARADPSSQGASPSSAAQPAGNTANPSINELMAAFTRSGVGPDQVAIDLTYAPPLFFEVTGLPQPAEIGARPTLAFMLEETIHEGILPDDPPAVLLALETGSRATPYDVKVTATDPHHRTTRLLFAEPAERPTDPMDPNPERTLQLVVPFADGTVSAGNTFEWRLPIDLTAASPSMSPGASQ